MIPSNDAGRWIGCPFCAQQDMAITELREMLLNIWEIVMRDCQTEIDLAVVVESIRHKFYELDRAADKVRND
jgi:hypothetical protein